MPACLGQMAGADALLERTVLADGGATLSLQPLPGAARPLADAAGSFGGLALPTGLAVNAEERIYILDGQAHVIKRFDPCSATFVTLPCIGGPGAAPRQLCRPQGLAIAHRGDLYVADTGNRRVQVFALKGLTLRAIWGPLRVVQAEDGIHVEPAAAQWSTPEAGCAAEATFAAGVWQPWDAAVSRRNRVYVSDYANGLIHVFDVLGGWRTAFCGEGLKKPTHIALDRQERIYVVQEGQPSVTVLDAQGNLVEIIEFAAPETGERFVPTAIAVDKDGNLLVGERYSRRLHLCPCSAGGGHTYAGVCGDFHGLGQALAFDRAGNPLVGDAQRKAILRLQAGGALQRSGYTISQPLDSRTYRCQWHRLVMHAAIPAGAQVRVDTFSAEAEKSLAEVQALPEGRWSTGQVNAQVGEGEWDCLIQTPPGRYLWLRLTLSGDGATTPAINWLRVEYPRASSRQYLPAIYASDEAGGDLTDRLLSIFDTIRQGIARQIGDLASLFDPLATPAGPARAGDVDFLTWLASWLELTLDRHWPLAKRRRLVQQAHRLYALRGTEAGLRLHLQLYAGVEPVILEHFRVRRWLYLNHGRLGERSVLWGKAIVGRLQLDDYGQIGSFQLIDSGDPLRDPFHHFAHQFTVFIPRRKGWGEQEEQTLARIVELAKPAHTQGHVRLVEPRFRVGVQALVGLDTVIGEYPQGVVAGQARLGYDSLLGPSADEAQPPTLRVGVRARIGSSTLID